jgi:hypothetical protein
VGCHVQFAAKYIFVTALQITPAESAYYSCLSPVAYRDWPIALKEVGEVSPLRPEKQTVLNAARHKGMNSVLKRDALKLETLVRVVHRARATFEFLRCNKMRFAANRIGK